jgi:cytochrome c
LICIKESRAPAGHSAVYDIDEKLRNMRLISSLLLTTSLYLAPTYAAAAQSVQRGAEIARANCARCHSIERTGPSPFAPAPPFRSLHENYPVEFLEEALGEGIFTGHPAMPEFQLKPGQIGDFIAFLKSLE